MKKMRVTLALLAIFLASHHAAYAQTPAPKPLPVTPAPDLSKLNIDQILQQLEATASAEETSPLQVVARFLQLRTGQVSELEQLLQARQATLVPPFQKAQSLIQQLGVLLNSGADPAQVGVLVIQIHALQQQIAQAQQAFLTQFAAILDPDQQQKLHAVQIATQLRPVLPAFQPIFLF